MTNNNKIQVTVQIDLKKVEVMKLNSYAKYHYLN